MMGTQKEVLMQQMMIWGVQALVIIGGRPASSDLIFVPAIDRLDALTKAKMWLEGEGYRPTSTFSSWGAEPIRVIGPTELELCEMCVRNGHIFIFVVPDENHVESPT